MARQIVIDIIGDATKFTKATKEATGSASKFGDLFGKGLGLGAGISAFGLAQDAIGRVTDYLGDAVGAARDEEVGIKRLAAVLDSNVDGWDGNTDAIDKNIDAMVRSTGFSDDQLRDSLGKLVGATKDVTKATDLQRVAMDLARLKGIDLVSASQILIDVEGGRYKQLGKLIGSTKEITSLTEAMAAVTEVAGGQQAAYMDTAASKTDILNNRLADLQEEIGGRLSPVLLTGTENVLAFMDALDPDAPVPFMERLQGLGDIVRTVNPLMWTGNLNAGYMADAIKKAGDEAGTAALLMDTYAEKNAAAREPTNKLAAANRNLSGSLGLVAQNGADALAAVQADIDWMRELGYLAGTKGKTRTTKKAAGGAASGLTWVGEQGPELVNLPSGSFVNNAQKSRQMAGSGPAIVVNVAGSVIGPSGVDELMDMMAYRLRLDGV